MRVLIAWKFTAISGRSSRSCCCSIHSVDEQWLRIVITFNEISQQNRVNEGERCGRYYYEEEVVFGWQLNKELSVNNKSLNTNKTQNKEIKINPVISLQPFLLLQLVRIQMPNSEGCQERQSVSLILGPTSSFSLSEPL